MSNNNPSDLDDLRKILSPEEFDKIIPDEILDQLKCSHCGGYLVAQFYDEYRKHCKVYTPCLTDDGSICGYCRKFIPDSELERQIKMLKS